MIKLLIVLLLLTGCTQAQPELRETKEVQTSIPYSDEELLEMANEKVKDYHFETINSQSDTEVWFGLDNGKSYVFKYENGELIPDHIE